MVVVYKIGKTFFESSDKLTKSDVYGVVETMSGGGSTGGAG